MRAKLVIIVVFVVLVTLLMGWLMRSMSPASEDLTVVVEQRDFEVKVEAPGKLEAGDPLHVEVRARGNILTYLAPEGKQVSKGEVLARFDETVLRERVLTRRNDLRMAEARYAEKLQQMTVRIRENAAEIAMRRADLAIKRTEFKRLRSLPHPDDVARGELERDYRASQLKIAEQDLENIRSLMKRNARIFSR